MAQDFEYGVILDAAIEYQRSDARNCVAASIRAALIEGTYRYDQRDEIAQSLIPHLMNCDDCFRSLSNAILMYSIPVENDGRSLLEKIIEDISEARKWIAAGMAATQSAHRVGMESGTGYVYGRDGKVFLRAPDGNEYIVKGE